MKKNQIFAGLFLMVAAALVAFTFDAPGIVMAFPAAVAGVISSIKLKEQRTELEEKREKLDDELLSIVNKAETEKREFTDDEKSKRASLAADIQKLNSEIENLTTEIEQRELEENIKRRKAGNFIKKSNEERELNEIKEYSVVRAIRDVLKGGLQGFELEMDQEARKEAKDLGIPISGNIAIPSMIVTNKRKIEMLREKRASLSVGTYDGTSGGAFVREDVRDFISALYAKNVLLGLGANLVTGLRGNWAIPKSAGATVAWEGENDVNADGTPTMSQVTASPKRLGAYGLLSKTTLMQSENYDVEALVRNDIINAINKAVQDAAIEGGGTGEPSGILDTSGIGDVAGGTDGAAPTSANIIALENEVAVDDADIGQLAYLTNPKVRAKLKNTALDAGAGLFVWDLKSANELMGYKAGVTTSVPSDLTKGGGSSLSAIIFGNFSDLILCQWGGFDIVADPYTLATYNQVRVVINSFWDVVVRRAVSFAAMKDAITTLG